MCRAPGAHLTNRKDRGEDMYDCAKPHRHRLVDALDEIAAWVDWLKQRGASDIVLLGHSRGGNQAAWYAKHSLATSRFRDHHATHRLRPVRSLQQAVPDTGVLCCS